MLIFYPPRHQPHRGPGPRGEAVPLRAQIIRGNPLARGADHPATDVGRSGRRPGGTGAMRFLILGALGLGGSLYLGHCLWLAWLAWWLG